MADPSGPATGGGDGLLAVNIMHFARVLRRAGLPVGTGKVLRAIEAAEAVGLARRDDFYWALHAVLVDRREQTDIFNQAFHVFWRDPDILKKMMGMILPTVRTEVRPADSQLARRLAEALHPGRHDGPPPGQRPEQHDDIEIDAALTWSDREQLGKKDFEKMSVEELATARQAITRMVLPVAALPTRRFRPHPTGDRIDLRATLRQSVRAGGMIELARKKRRTRPPTLVVLCDISGSMTRYSRMLLHFLHTLTNDRDRVYSFLFGTRLTNITRHLRHRDPDTALERVAGAVADWSGGTRIGAALHMFNTVWSRRVLGQGAVVLLITDGLDRDAGEGLAVEMERLHKSCRRLIWLNPLLRYEGFAPRSSGIRAIMPHVDDFRPVHNLESLAELARILGNCQGPRRHGGMARWLAEAKEHSP